MAAKKRILIVDDSVVFRSQLRVALETVAELEVVGAASNGKFALQKIEQDKVDLIVLDLEMPEMTGLEFLNQIKGRSEKPIVIVFSASSALGAATTLEALRLGAADYVLKPSGNVKTIDESVQLIKTSLIPKILSLLKTRSLPHEPTFLQQKTPSSPTQAKNWEKIALMKMKPQVLVIASSTGGPPTLEAIFSQAQGPFRVPILIAQHMPPVFTNIFAERLMAISGIEVAEAKQGEVLKANKIYIAPGDFHLQLRKTGDQVSAELTRTEQRNYVRPSADFLLESAADIFGAGCLAMVLTGMGSDGRDGAIRVKTRGGGVFIQNKETCQVWGMPAAVFEAQAYDAVGTIEDGARLIQALCGV